MKTALTSRPTSCLRASLIGLILLVFPVSVTHAQYYVRGDFNGWSGTEALMSDEGNGLFTYLMTGLTPGEMYEFKVTTDDWSVNWPGSNAKAMANANGEILFRAFDQESWSDGWFPNNTRRVGYSDSGLHGWDIAGSMNGWSGGEAWELTNLGNGLYRGEFFLDAGEYDFKFRKAGDWAISIGNDFGNAAGDVYLNVPSADTYVFQLDLMNGRYNVSVIPEPSTYAVLLGVGVLGLTLLRRRKAAR